MGLFAFSQSEKPLKAELLIRYAGTEQRVVADLKHGINYVALPSLELSNGDLNVQLQVNGETQDTLAVQLNAIGNGWQVTQNQRLDVASGDTPLRDRKSTRLNSSH